MLDSATFDRIAFVSRRDDDKDAGYQRNFSKQRAADIARYIDKENGCIPNSILVTLEPGSGVKRPSSWMERLQLTNLGQDAVGHGL